MEKKEPKIPYIHGAPEGLDKGDHPEHAEEAKRLSPKKRSSLNPDDIPSDEPDPLERLIQNEEREEEVEEEQMQELAISGGSDKITMDDMDDTDDEKPDTEEDGEREDDDAVSEENGNPQNAGKTEMPQKRTNRFERIGRRYGKRPAQKPPYKDKIGRQTIRKPRPAA